MSENDKYELLLEIHKMDVDRIKNLEKENKLLSLKNLELREHVKYLSTITQKCKEIINSVNIKAY